MDQTLTVSTCFLGKDFLGQKLGAIRALVLSPGNSATGEQATGSPMGFVQNLSISLPTHLSGHLFPTPTQQTCTEHLLFARQGRYVSELGLGLGR